MKPILTVAVLGFFLAVPQPVRALDKAELNTRFQSYFKNGKAVVDMALSKKVDVAQVEKSVEQMLAEASWMAKEYAQIHRKGEKLLNVVVNNVGSMKKLSFHDLEHDWHDLHHFETADKDIGL